MIRLPLMRRFGPIGVDVGSSSVKLVQLTADHTQLVDAARWDYRSRAEDLAITGPRDAEVIESLQRMREGRRFRGRDAVLCLNDRQLLIQNIRLAKSNNVPLDRQVQQEAAARTPFPIEEAEIRYVEAGDVRQGEAVLREVILMACHRPVLEHTVALCDEAGLRPISVDVEPAALLRSQAAQSRREEDRAGRLLIVHIGYARTMVVMAHGDEMLFAKYVVCGGRQMDEAVAAFLEMSLDEARALRRNNGDRRSDHQDPEVTSSVMEAVRPVIEQLLSELAMCVRYYSVTFRGSPLNRMVLGGGEASQQLGEILGQRLGISCELGDPMRSFATSLSGPRRGFWDVAAGLAMKPLE